MLPYEARRSGRAAHGRAGKQARGRVNATAWQGSALDEARLKITAQGSDGCPSQLPS